MRSRWRPSPAEERWLEVESRFGAAVPRAVVAERAGGWRSTGPLARTALFVLGPDSAVAWGNRHPDVGVLVLDRRDGAVRPRWSDGLRPALDSSTAMPLR